MILCVRDKTDAKRDAETLAQHGFVAQPAPVMDVVQLDTPLPDTAQFQGLIYTSRQAIKAAHTKFSQRAFCVGRGSAQAARDAGFQDVISGDAGGEHLMQQIKAHAQPNLDPLYWPHGAVIQFDIAKALTDDGFTVLEDTTYRLVPIERLPESIATDMQCAQVGVVMCFSAQHLSQFARLLDKTGLWHHHKNWRLIVPTLRVANAVSAEWAEVIVAETPSYRAMMSAAQAYYHSQSGKAD